MKGKTILIVLVAVLATAASTIVATRAITGSVRDGRIAAASIERYLDSGVWQEAPEPASV